MPGKHRRVADHDIVAGEAFPVPLDERREVDTSDLLLTFGQHDHVDRKRAASVQVRGERHDMHPELSLVIHRAPRKELAVADGRFERRRGPEFVRLRWLHVVMPVDEHGRRAGRRLAPFGEHDGVPRRGHHLGPETDARERRVKPRGGTRRVGVVFGARAHARDAQEGEELVHSALRVRGEPAVEVGRHCGGNSHGRSWRMVACRHVRGRYITGWKEGTAGRGSASRRSCRRGSRCACARSATRRA